MPSLTGIRRRIKSAKNIAQITKAMEMVSASKMRKSQEQALATRPFSDKLVTIIDNITSSSAQSIHPLMRPCDSPRHGMLIIVSTDKGLCGGLNVNLFRAIANWGSQESRHDKLHMVHVRKKARTILPNKETELTAVFHEISETPTFEEARTIARLGMDTFLSGDVDEVFIAYPKFISTLVNQPTITRLLPLAGTHPTQTTSATYTFEPTSSELITELFPYMVEMSIYQILIDASASEHSARMVAMKNASDNATDLISNLTLDYNQARQSQVTTELLDATTARMALT
ncbi:MAG: ATP synthase F1 subunit gamma [bacterium]